MHIKLTGHLSYAPICWMGCERTDLVKLKHSTFWIHQMLTCGPRVFISFRVQWPWHQEHELHRLTLARQPSWWYTWWIHPLHTNNNRDSSISWLPKAFPFVNISDMFISFSPITGQNLEERIVPSCLFAHWRGYFLSTLIHNEFPDTNDYLWCVYMYERRGFRVLFDD